MQLNYLISDNTVLTAFTIMCVYLMLIPGHMHVHGSQFHVFRSDDVYEEVHLTQASGNEVRG